MTTFEVSAFTYVLVSDTDLVDIDGVGSGIRIPHSKNGFRATLSVGTGFELEDTKTGTLATLRIASAKKSDLLDLTLERIPVVFLCDEDEDSPRREVPLSRVNWRRDTVLRLILATATARPSIPSIDWMFARQETRHAVSGGVYIVLVQVTEEQQARFPEGSQVRALQTCMHPYLNVPLLGRKECGVNILCEGSNEHKTYVKCGHLSVLSYYAILGDF
jgi:hypothetical protein